MTAPARPIDTPSDQPTTGKTPDFGKGLTLREQAQRLHAEMSNERQSFISHWRDINRVLFPRRGRFTLTDANKGDRRNKDIIDSTATFAARTLASGMMSGITSPARQWFRLTTIDAELANAPAVKEWLYQLTQRMFDVLAKSNFYDTMHMVYGDQGVYGTAPFLVDEDDEDVIRCYPFPVGSYNIANDEKLRVRSFSREWQMTTRQLIGKYGARCSAAVRTAWESGQAEQWWPVTQVIFPNPDFNPGRIASRYKRFRSVSYESGTNEGDGLLRDSGYDEFPVLVARWETTAEDVYATDCPGMLALGDINQLQFGEKKGMQALEKKVNPPLVSPTSLKNSPVTQLPGGITYDDNETTKGLRPLHQVTPDLADLENKQSQVRSRIERAFFADLFLMISQMEGADRPTATEIAERKQEKLLALGPMLNRLDKGVFNPFVDRLFQIMLRRGQVPPPPRELQGQELKAEYISILHAAQKSDGLGQLERFTTYAVTLAEKAQDPSILDRIDKDALIETYHDMSGVDPKILRSDEAVAQLRAQRQKQQQQMQQADSMMRAGKGAKDLAAADTGGKNALTDILAGVGGGQ